LNQSMALSDDDKQWLTVQLERLSYLPGENKANDHR
jgi:hypothetical protein